jgi:hypothetical protein
MDTINLKLLKESAPNTNFLNEVPKYLTEVYNNGNPVQTYGKETIIGKLAGFSVNVNEDRVIIKDSSLQKFYLKHNLGYFGRAQIQSAFELLSDTIHLPVIKSNVQGFHFGINNRVQYSAGLYLPYFGNKPHCKRNEQSSGINYKTSSKEFAIYDKIREMKDKRVAIPELYSNSHYLRFENRYKTKLDKHFNIASITPETLYSEDFYINLCNELYNSYKSIDKLKKIKIDMQSITKVKEYQSLGVLTLIEAQGGKINALNNVNERYKKGELTKKQTYDLKRLINECTKLSLQTIENDMILELDKSIKDNLRYYR